MTALLDTEHHAGPPAGEPPYFRSCVACCQPWPCPAKREQLRAEAEELAAERGRRNPQRMLDVSEVVPGCWVSWRGAENADFVGEPRGGVVISIEHIVDENGESMRVFNTAKESRHGIRWDRLTQAQVGSIDQPNAHTVHSLRRAMAREMGRCQAAVMTDERRMAEAIPILMRSVA